MTLGLTSLQPHAMVPSLLSVEGKRIVLPAFFQRGRDTPDKTRQTLATAHCVGPTHRLRFRNSGATRSQSNRPSVDSTLPGPGGVVVCQRVVLLEGRVMLWPLGIYYQLVAAGWQHHTALQLARWYAD
jgi:hypothetical protein